MIRKTLKQAFSVTVPVMAGYLFLGITFGLLCRTNGFSAWVPAVMSILIYSGALEFAAVPLLSAAFDPVTAFVLGLTLSARHLFYGLPLLKKYARTGKEKAFLIFGLTDETFSILSSSDVPEGCSDSLYYFAVTLFDYGYWTVGTALGALLGSAVSFPLEGLDFSLTALFIVLFLEQIRTKQGIRSGVLGVACACAALIFVGKTYFILVTMAMILPVLLFGRRFFGHE